MRDKNYYLEQWKSNFYERKKIVEQNIMLRNELNKALEKIIKTDSLYKCLKKYDTKEIIEENIQLRLKLNKILKFMCLEEYRSANGTFKR